MSSAGVGRTSFSASAAMLFSTALGFVRNLVLASAIGTGLVADSYNIANQVPYQIFTMLGGGAIAFVLVPQLMRQAQVSEVRRDEYGSLLLAAGVALGLIVTFVLLAISPVLIRWMGGASWGQAQSSLGLRFTLWCIPQVFFYALYSMASQLMYARGHFITVAWIPIANSLVVILSCIPLIAVGTIEANSPASVQNWEVVLLGGATLLGSALQAALLLALLRRAGFRPRFRFQIRGMGLRVTATAGLFTLGTVFCSQVANLVTAALSTQAGSAAKALGDGGRGYTAFFLAQLLFNVASTVASGSLANILLQRLSKNYADGAAESASSEINDAILVVGSLLVPVMSIFICLGPLGGVLLFTRGETSSSAAHFIGVALAVFGAGLVPHALHEILVRPFYAVHDARTPLISAGIITSVLILGAIAASVLLPPRYVILGIAGAVSLAYIVDLPLRLRSLKKQLDFKVSKRVVQGYRRALGAAALSTAVVGTFVMYLEQRIPQQWFLRTVLFVGGLVGFLIIYYPLTARSPASLRRLVQWLRT